jgi:hypothetical protein
MGRSFSSFASSIVKVRLIGDLSDTALVIANGLSSKPIAFIVFYAAWYFFPAADDNSPLKPEL